MFSQRPTRFALLLSAALSLVFTGISVAQSPGPPNVTGGNSLVVSRASLSTPSATTAPSLSSVSVVSWKWNAIALASVRNWAWSFAPALVGSSRPVAVRRRAVL